MKLSGKIGYSDIGGIYHNKGFSSKPHANMYLTIIISESNAFSITTKAGITFTHQAMIIPKQTEYRLDAELSDSMLFVHIDPYSEIGLELSHSYKGPTDLSSLNFNEVFRRLTGVPSNAQYTTDVTLDCINTLFELLSKHTENFKPLDWRIRKSIALIRANTFLKISLKDSAQSACLSPSHFAYLFKQETGVAFRKYVLFSKLAATFKELHKNRHIGLSSMMGGFADPPHFSRTFLKAFGITPSFRKK